MDPSPEDARRAVIALIQGQRDVQFGDFHLVTLVDWRVCLRYPRPQSGWSLRIGGYKLTWWPAFRARMGHELVLNELEHLIGCRLEYRGQPNAEYEVVGPLGLAALRAELNLKYPQQ